MNPNKCIFGVHKGKVLGCLVSTKGIEANPDKVKALWKMEEPKSIRDVQKLTGRIAALNRFIPRSTDRSLPFFKVLRSANKFEWGPEQSEALQALKNHLQNMVKITSPDPKDVLLLYIAASYSAVSAALVLERERRKKEATTCLFRIRSSRRLEASVLRARKNRICSSHVCPEASTLFRSSQDNRGNRSTLS